MAVDIQKIIEQLKAKFEKVFHNRRNTNYRRFRITNNSEKRRCSSISQSVSSSALFARYARRQIATLVKEEKIYQVYQSDWASPIVNVKQQDNTYRTCVNFKRTVNPQIDQEVYPLPIPEEAFTYLADGRVFAALGLADAYTQLKICTESAPLL